MYTNILTLFRRLTSAPLLISRDAISIYPFSSALCNGEDPSCFYYMKSMNI